MSGEETIASRFIKLNQIILGKSTYNLPNKYLAHRDGLLDVLFALYEECNVDYLRKDKYIGNFLEKFKGVMSELKSLRVNIKDFEIKKIIGRGHFGEVQVVREKATGDVYAMKTLRKDETLSRQNVAFYEEERDIMSKSESPWLTKLHYAFQDSQNLYLIMEFHPGGDMLSLLEKYDNVLPEDMCRFYLAELVLAIHSLHLMGYVHRDVKPDNILIDRTGHIKLADFGSSSKLNAHKQATSSMPVGTPDYAAPEVLTSMNPGPIASRSYGIECDWWSLGIVAYEMAFGSTPFADEKVLSTYNNIMNFQDSLKFPPEASEVSKTLLSFIRDLLKDSTSRSGYDQLIVHALFTDIDWNNIRNTAPPYVPTVTSVDDTSNFDDFEPESRPYFGELSGKKEFTGKNLPFVGFTYTTPIEMKIERMSSVDDIGIFSPSSSFCESDGASKRKERTALQNKILELSTSEESLKAELNKLKLQLETKDNDLEKSKNEKLLLKRIIQEKSTEVQQVKQLLTYEREHRVITEQKATQLVRCMKTKQRQDAIRLRAKSFEISNGEKTQFTLEEQLEEALAKIDEFIKERTEMLEELEATKRMLLSCQNNVENNSSSVLSDGDRSRSFLLNGLESSQNSSGNVENKAESENQDIRRLVSKLEKKNIQLEQDLEKAASERKETEAEVAKLRNKITQFENKVSELEREMALLTNQDSINEVQNTSDLSNKMKDLDSEENSCSEGTSGFSDESNIENEAKETTQRRTVEINEDTCSVDGKNLPQLSMTAIKNIDIPCENINNSIERENKIQEGLMNNEKGQVSFENISSLKEENEFLKTRMDVLNVEIRKVKEDINEKEGLCSSLENQLREKEVELSDAKLDLRISLRKEQQAESVTSALRERNKELREKMKELEGALCEKLQIENELKEKLSDMESKLSEKAMEAAEKQKLFEIEKAKLEYTCEVSKDVTQKFAKSQDHYGEVVKQNMDLIREKEEKNQTHSHLLDEIKNLKKELTQKRNECVKLDKINILLKSQCSKIDEDLDEMQILITAKDESILELQDFQQNLKSELKTLEESLKLCKADLAKAEKENEKLVKHVEELTAEMDNNSLFFETEMEDLQEQLIHYKKIAAETEAQNEKLSTELISNSSKCKIYSEKNIALDSQLCEIKEEAARHITQISSLKSSNLKLTQALEEALEDYKEVKLYADELLTEIDAMKVNHLQERVKLEETVSQQTKLIDFLQSKTETMEKRKKANISRFFGKKDNASNQIPLQYRDVEKLLEGEKNRCRRLQDQLSQARAEVVALQREISVVRKSAVNVEVPQSPMSRAMHCVITQSPHADSESPALVSRELVNKISKPLGMKHKIPHRFSNIMCMRSTKCCACLDTLHFGRTLAKCQECSTICHPTCASSLPSTCGLPMGFMQHFKSALNSCSSSVTEDCENRLSEGWVKIPKSNKLGWDRRYLRLMDSMLYVFENAEEDDLNRAVMKFDFSPKVAKIIVTSAVSATEMTYAAPSDLPFVLKLDYLPHTTCWPKRCLYIMTLNFNDKQMWFSTLDALAQESITEVDSCQKNKLVGKAVWTLKGDKLMDPLCTYILDDTIVLLGAVDGLYVLKIVNKFTCSLKCKVDGLQYVYQIACLKSIGLVIFIEGSERRLTMTSLTSVQSAVRKIGSSSLTSKLLADISDCHLFSVDDTYHNDTPYLCVATSKSVMLLKWDSVLKTFCNKRVFETKEPCSCIHFTPNSVICGTDSFHKLDLHTFTAKNFLDDQDTTLAGLIYGASHFRSYPIAIFQVSSSDEPVEYLLCFHELGVFVNCNGHRTRSEDMKWSRLPLTFAYQLPYLFVLHFNSIEVIEIPPPNASESGLQAVTLIQNPQYLGPAPLEQSVYLSSCHDQVIELILVEGKSIGRTIFESLKVDTESVNSYNSSSSEKESVAESEGLEFSFSTSIEHSLAEISPDQMSVSSKTSSDSASSQS